MTNTDDKPEIQYWDSCMFISLLTGLDHTRVEVIRELIDRRKRGFIRIVTSTFALAEIRPRESDRTANPSNYAVAKELMESDELDVRALTPIIGRRAQEIGCEAARLYPGDCVHIATALDARADVLFTFDGSGAKRRNPNAMIAHSLRFGEPPLHIREPFVDRGPIFNEQTDD